MYSLNSVEKCYTLEELKQDWMFKLLYKFFKHYGLWDKITENHPLSITKEGTNKVWTTMHSNNYCVTKMFRNTITCSIPWYLMTSQQCKKYDLLWIQFLKQHINIVPDCIKEMVEVGYGLSIEAYIDNEYTEYIRQIENYG